MEDAIETAGTIAAGAILAREVDRAHAPGHDPSGACANCGTRLVGPFCQRCGQHGHVHRTAGALVHDILHGVFHFEGRFWATLPLLAWRPGDLTRRYVHGERARFVSPMAIFLFSVFLMFAVLANLPGWSFGGGLLDGSVPAKLNAARESVAEGKAKADAEVARYARLAAEARAKRPVDAGAVASLDRRLAKAREDQADLVRVQALLPGASEAAPKVHSSSKWVEERFQHARENPKLLLYKVKSSAYKYSWALIPFSLPFLWLLFPLRRDVGLYDHAIFATYSLAFMSLLTVALGLLGWAGASPALLVVAALVIPVLHIYRQLKGAYRLGRLGALWRTAWMVGFITIIIIPLFALMLLYLGVAD